MRGAGADTAPKRGWSAWHRVVWTARGRPGNHKIVRGLLDAPLSRGMTAEDETLSKGITLLESEGVQDHGAREKGTQDQSKQLGNLTLAHVQPPVLYVKPSAVTG